MKLSPPAPLSRDHLTDIFDCGNQALNGWLRSCAWQSQQAGAARTFTVCRGKDIVGYYSLAVGAVDRMTAPERIKKGPARQPIPIVVLTRLAVDKQYQGMGIGKGLLKDAVLRTLKVSEHAGIRAIFVQAKDDIAQSFYEKFGFEPSPVEPLQLMLLMKDAKKILEGFLSK